MKKEELDITLLKNSFDTLNQCYKDYCSQKDEKIKEYIKDSCIKRFEYTYETSKKIMNKFLKKEYDKNEKDLTINNIFREMYGFGFIKNFENWVNYREQRNNTSHEYDIEKARTVIVFIPDFIEDVRFFIEKLDKHLEQNG